MSGCASHKTPRTAVNAKDEVHSIQEALGCEWQKKPDPLYPVAGADYACVLDRFSSVILFIMPDEDVVDTGAPALKKLTLLWKAWHPGAHVTSAKPEASRAIAYIAQRFFSEKDAFKLVDTFFGESHQELRSNGLKATYTYQTQPQLGLHKLELKSTSRHNQWFVFPKKITPQPTADGAILLGNEEE